MDNSSKALSSPLGLLSTADWEGGVGLERNLTETHKNVRLGFTFNRQRDVNVLANSSDLL